jgi:hypothetical protein
LGPHIIECFVLCSLCQALFTVFLQDLRSGLCLDLGFIQLFCSNLVLVIFVFYRVLERERERERERVLERERSMAGGGGGGGKAEEPQPHPPKDQLPNISYCITSPPPWRDYLSLIHKFFFFLFFVLCLPFNLDSEL